MALPPEVFDIATLEAKFLGPGRGGINDMAGTCFVARDTFVKRADRATTPRLVVGIVDGIEVDQQFQRSKTTVID